MIRDLASRQEIACDLEFSPSWTEKTFWMESYPCLLQFSTEETDYVVDCLTLGQEIQDGLKGISQNSDIIKVFHDARQDVRKLQFFYKIFPVGIIDMQVVHEQFGGIRQASFEVMLLKYCKPETALDKDLQMADWRLRPIPIEMLEYALSLIHI